MKKTASVQVPFFLYLQMAQDPRIEQILPSEIGKKIRTARQTFFTDHAFLSQDDYAVYLKSPYVRLLCGPDLYRFFAKILSLNYQAFQHLLQIKPGSLEEYFQEGAPYWNEAFLFEHDQETDLSLLRDGLFFLACLNAQIDRFEEKKFLHQKLDRYTKEKMAAYEARLQGLENRILELESQKAALEIEAQDKITWSAQNPYHMLGLEEADRAHVEERATTLIKILHPDLSGSQKTAYLFNLILNARDQILNGD